MARDFPTGCISKSSRTPQLDLVHRLVKPCSYGNHGRPGAQGAFRAWHLRGEIPASANGGHLATSASGGPGSENCFLICLSPLGNHPAARVASLGLQPSSPPVKMYLSPLCGRGGTGRRTSLRGWR